MRVNVYSAELTDRIEIRERIIHGEKLTGVRVYLELPVTTPHGHVKGPFQERPECEDSSAVTFWSKNDARPMFRKALSILDGYYGEAAPLELLRDLIAALPEGALGTVHQPVPPYKQDLIPVAMDALNKEITLRRARAARQQQEIKP